VLRAVVLRAFKWDALSPLSKVSYGLRHDASIALKY
jgi:hypothetical protein